MEQESVEMNEQTSSNAYEVCTVNEFTDMRLLIIRCMIHTIIYINSINPNSYLDELINMLEKYHTSLKGDNIRDFIFAEIKSLQSTSEIPPFKYINFMTTAERLYTMSILCQYFDQLIKHAQQVHDINNTLFLSELVKNQFRKELCALKQRFVKEANELHEFIKRPDMDKYTLSVIRFGLIKNIVIHIEFNQVGDEFDKLNTEILNKIEILDREELTASAYHDVEMSSEPLRPSIKRSSDLLNENSSKRFKF